MGSRSPHDDELDRMLEAASAGDPGELPLFVRDVRAAYPAGSLASEDLHVAAMLDASHLADKGDPVARPVSNADAPDGQASRLPKRKGNHVRDRKLRPILKVLAPVFALLMLFSGMAFAGILPISLNDTPADVTVDQGDVDVDDETEADDDADDQGEDGDHQGEDEDRDANEDEDEDAHADDDQGEDADEDSDGQGEDGDHQGEDDDEDSDDEDSDDEDSDDEESGDEDSDDDDEDEDNSGLGSDDDSDEDDSDDEQD